MIIQYASRLTSIKLSKPITRFGRTGFSIFSIKQKKSDDKKHPAIEANGLYYGEFTENEYKEAERAVKEQLSGLELDIKGQHNVRENLSKMSSYPILPSKSRKLKIDSLTDILAESIKTTGPISLSAYIRQCLTHPEYGYYTTRDPLDSMKGDFITSPEISSMFGEMMGVWFYSMWIKQNSPSYVRIIEFGPGKGTLIHDCIKSFNKLNKSMCHIEVILVEASPVLKNEQWKLLCNPSNPLVKDDEGLITSKTIWGNDIKWVDTEKDIKSQPKTANYIIAHEFFDALPIKSFQRIKEGWRELLVDHTPSVNNTQQKLPQSSDVEVSNFNKELLNTNFHLTMSPRETLSSKIPEINERFNNLPIESRVEICPDAELYISKMTELVDNEDNLGAALVVDYGQTSGVPDNTLRGIFKHQFVSPFYQPGEVDLSVDVDFEGLKILAEKSCSTFGPTKQGDWLHEVGIGYRTEQLIKEKQGKVDEQEKIYNAYKRLTSEGDNYMGSIYKFLCLAPKGSDVPIGFGGFFK